MYIDLRMYRLSRLRVYVGSVSQAQSLCCGSESVWYRLLYSSNLCSVLHLDIWRGGASDFTMHDTDKKPDPTHPEVSMGKPELELGSTEIVNKEEERAYGTPSSHPLPFHPIASSVLFQPPKPTAKLF